MSEINWAKSYAWVRQSEGGNDDDPDDAGGRTSRGITQNEWNAYCDVMKLPRSDVWAAPEVSINDIYHRSYWMPWCPALPPGGDYSFFDECVNSGPHEASLILQRALGFTGKWVDGHIGVMTSAALGKIDPKALVDNYADERVKVYKVIEADHPQDVKFDKGWLNRVEFARINALSLIG